MMGLFVLCLMVATLLWPALAQAPDASPRCIDETATDPSFEPYPEEWRVLFDTWNYESLLVSGGVLQVLNNDGGNGWTGQQSTCREQLRVCDYRQDTQPQNNWVFTQYISYLEAIEVNVDVTYDYTSCATNRANGCDTLQTTMYLYERNGADNTARTNPNNYLPNELQVLSANGRGTYTSTFTFRPSANINGFYLGVQDTGTCGNINRITVYYRICPGETPGLVTFPETPLPPFGTSQPNTKTGTCAANSSPTNPIYRAFADGRCETSGSCDCDSGFRLNGGSSCVACPAGTYRSASDPAGSCLGCPENTDMTRVAAPSCACLLGYYRTATEGAGVRCTMPGCPSGIVVVADLVLVWQAPENPNGVIVGYDVRASLLNDDDRTLYIESLIPPDTFFHVLRRSQLPANSNIRYEVRAITSVGPGEWCGDVTFSTNINECDINNGGCSQICTNTQGSRQCSCRTGYRLACDGIACLDINECNMNNGGCSQICTNLQGSRQCSCSSGFILTSDGRTCQEHLTVSISADGPTDLTPCPNMYRAASGPVTVTCTATGPGTGAVSYRWSSTCRSCPFQSATSSSIRRAAVHSGDTGIHTCMATQDGMTASASIDFYVVDAGMQLFRGSPRGNLPNNGLAISNNPGSGFRLRIFCRSDSMSANVGWFIGPNGIVTSNSSFAIASPQPGEVTLENIVDRNSPITASEQGVYTCLIPLESGKIRELNVGIYPSGFNILPSIVRASSVRLGSSSNLTCTTTGSPATKVMWQINGNTVTIDGSTSQLTQTVADRVSSTYENVLTIAAPDRPSNFTCTVENALGSATSALISI